MVGNHIAYPTGVRTAFSYESPINIVERLNSEPDKAASKKSSQPSVMKYIEKTFDTRSQAGGK